MTQPRRRILRSQPTSSFAARQTSNQFQKLQTKLDKERLALNRWQTRLRRAFKAVLKGQQRVARLEKQINQKGASS